MKLYTYNVKQLKENFNTQTYGLIKFRMQKL